MDGSASGDLAGLIGLLLASAFFAASEAGLLATTETRLRRAAGKDSVRARLGQWLVRRRSFVLAVILAGITASNYTAERLATHLALRYDVVWAPTAVAIAMTVVVVVFCDAIPLQLGARAPERVVSITSPVIAAVSVLMAPAVLLLLGMARAVLWLMGVGGSTARPPVDEEELRAMIDVGSHQGVLDEPQRVMLHRILDFGDLTAGEVMTPRTDLVAVETTTPVHEAVRVGLASGHSRLPVYSQTIDEIAGILHIKDCLPYLRENKADVQAGAVARPALFVPDTLRADQLLQQLQAAGRTAAIVKDEFGGTAGMVTMEDLLESIVGAIQDEYDVAEQPEIVKTGEGEWLCAATANVPDVEMAVGATLPEGPWDTVGGLIIHHLGRLPSVGDKVVVNGIELEVLEMDGARIGQVRVRRRAKPEIDSDRRSSGPEEVAS
ncbi:MAG: HlyC/CorC family transporter [Armatimonadetes bacterium]|nr:HlyC/CorC family transporter [Armatimonadota bacterium]